MPLDRSPAPEASYRATATGGAAAFLRWWAGELAALVPGGARNALRRRRARPVVAFDTGAATILRPAIVDGALAMTELARIPLDGDPAQVDEAGRRAVGSLARVVYGGAAAATRVRVALPPRSVLRRRLVLPAAVEENLRAAIGYDLDRLTPFKADEVYYDAAIVGRDAAQGTIDVDFAAARRPVVDEALARVAAWGAEVTGVSPESADAVASSTLNLVPDEARVAAPSWTRWQVWLPLGSIALLALAAMVVPVWQKRETAIAVIQRAETARQQAAVSERLRADLEKAVADYNYALERKHAWPPMVKVLDTVTRVLPDDTWLTQLDVRTVPRGRERERELAMRGESGNAGKLIPVLEESGLVAQVAPRSPTTKIQPGPGEIFDLSAQLKPAPRPASVPLIEPPPLVAPAAAAPAPATAPATAPALAPGPAPATPAGAAGPIVPAPVPSAPAAAKGGKP